MPYATIDYMNARRAAKPASGGAKQKLRRVEYAPDYEPDAFELALSAINSFALWAEASRAQYLIANGMSYQEELCDEIPF